MPESPLQAQHQVIEFARPREKLTSKTCYQHPPGPLAHGICLQGGKLTRIAVNTVRGEAARRRAGGEDEFAIRVEAEGVGYSLGRHLSDCRQAPVGCVYGEARDAVVAPIGNIQEFPRRGDLNLGAGVPSGVAVGEGRYSLKSRKCS